MDMQASSTRRGSIYLITLITVAAVVSMVLIGVSLRSSSNVQSALIEQMAEGSNAVLDVTEYSFELIASDSQWKTNAQTGTVLDGFVLGESILTSTVIDADTLGNPTYDTMTYRITASSAYGTLESSVSVDVLTSKYDYITFLKSLSAKHYWALDERSNPAKAIDGIGSYDADYLEGAVAGADTNDEGGLVPVFADANDHISVPWDKDFRTQDGTFAMWINYTGPEQNEFSSFLGMDYQQDGVPAINMAIFKNTVTVYLNESGVLNVLLFSEITDTDSITPGTWHHVATTWGSDGLKIYIDGVRKDGINPFNFNSDGLDTSGDPNGKQPLHIGGGYDMIPNDTPEVGFLGSVAHVVFFNKQLTGAQVAELAAIKPDLLSFSLVDGTWVRVFE